MSRTIVATDGSPSASEAVDLAVDLAAHHGDDLVFVHVVPALDIVSAWGAQDAGHALPYEPTSRDVGLLAEAADTAAARGVSATTRLLAGAPVDEILAAAGRCDASLIIVGSRGHSAIVSALLGSVSQGVLRRSTRRVLVVRGATSSWIPAQIPRSAPMNGTTEPRWTSHLVHRDH